MLYSEFRPASEERLDTHSVVYCGAAAAGKSALASAIRQAQALAKQAEAALCCRQRMQLFRLPEKSLHHRRCQWQEQKQAAQLDGVAFLFFLAFFAFFVLFSSFLEVCSLLDA